MNYSFIAPIKFIGKTGFEPATPWSQTRCSTKLSHFPLYAPWRIWTFNLLIRSQTLYPVALRAHHQCRGSESNRYGWNQPRDFKSRASTNSATPACLMKAEDGIRTRDPDHGKVVFYHWTTSATTNIIIAKLIFFAILFDKKLFFYSTNIKSHYLRLKRR